MVIRKHGGAYRGPTRWNRRRYGTLTDRVARLRVTGARRSGETSPSPRHRADKQLHDLLGEAMQPVRRALLSLHERTFGRSWMLAGISVLGIWGVWNGILRNRARSAHGRGDCSSIDGRMRPDRTPIVNQQRPPTRHEAGVMSVAARPRTLPRLG